MSKKTPKKKKIVIAKKKVLATKGDASTAASAISPTVSKTGLKQSNQSNRDVKSTLIFTKENYIMMGIGALLIAFGLLLMSGGGMDDPNEWIPEQIYSKRITLLAPIVILSGLVLEIFAIFRRTKV